MGLHFACDFFHLPLLTVYTEQEQKPTHTPAGFIFFKRIAVDNTAFDLKVAQSVSQTEEEEAVDIQ